MKHLHTLTLAVFSLPFADVGFAAEPAAAKAVPYKTYDGYFVSNKFQPDLPASHVWLLSQKAFDEVFGEAHNMFDTHHRLAKDAFESKMVIGIIKRGHATWEFKVVKVAEKDGVLEVNYTATSKSTPETTFAFPLILSVPKSEYKSIQFIENGKTVKTLKPRA